MTREEALRALLVGVERAEAATAEGVDALAAGDMGIGNTTPAAALATVFTGRPVGAVTGRGTGIEDAVWRHKVAVINRALALNRPTPATPWGPWPRWAAWRSPASPGSSWEPPRPGGPCCWTASSPPPGPWWPRPWSRPSTDYLIAAHRSVEPGHQIMLDHPGTEALAQSADAPGGRHRRRPGPGPPGGRG